MEQPKDYERLDCIRALIGALQYDREIRRSKTAQIRTTKGLWNAVAKWRNAFVKRVERTNKVRGLVLILLPIITHLNNERASQRIGRGINRPKSAKASGPGARYAYVTESGFSPTLEKFLDQVSTGILTIQNAGLPKEQHWTKQRLTKTFRDQLHPGNITALRGPKAALYTLVGQLAGVSAESVRLYETKQRSSAEDIQDALSIVLREIFSFPESATTEAIKLLSPHFQTVTFTHWTQAKSTAMQSTKKITKGYRNSAVTKPALNRAKKT